MKTSVSAFALAFIVVGCGSGAPPGENDVFNTQRSNEAASNGQRQAVLDACKPPFTGANGTGGKLTRAFCGVALPTSGADRTPQRWWDAAGCIADHPTAFSKSCKQLFKATCGNGDNCICDTGYKLDEDDTCIPENSCDNDNDCKTVANGKNKCSNTVEHDPPQGQCVITCNGGFVLSNGACVRCTPTTCAAQGKNCGSISNGCGGTLSCGTCITPQTCGGGGTANVCGGGCTPTTCAAAGANCGSVSNGCGGTLSCGTCTAPQTCGGGGTANVCGGGTTKFIFVTSAIYSGNLGGLSGADAKCQALATNASLPGTYKAWLSTSATSAGSRLTHSTLPYVLVNGTPVAANWTGLTSAPLLHTIDMTELGGSPPSSTGGACGTGMVYTDTNPDGSANSDSAGNFGDCNGWTTSLSAASEMGDYNESNSPYWTASCASDICSYQTPLYCLQQ